MATATKKAKPVRLPKKPSALIRIALEDLAKAERSPKCIVDMNKWHRPDEAGEKCAVCMAGAVMRSTLKVPDTAWVSPSDYRENEKQLEAINELRTGDCAFAFHHLGLLFSDGEKFAREIIPYEEDSGEFKRDMRKLAADLEAAGY